MLTRSARSSRPAASSRPETRDDARILARLSRVRDARAVSAEPPSPQPPYRAATLRPDPAPPTRKRALWVIGLAGFVAFTAAGAWSLERHRTPAPAPAQQGEAPSPLRDYESWVAGAAEDGAAAVVRREHRIAASRGGSGRAPVRFAANLLNATRVAGGWVFVAADGTVARADTFLGEPHDLGRLPCAFRVDRVSRGLATAVDADGSLLTTDGTAPFARVATPAPVRAAAFADPSFGAIILRDGAVAVTRDGGRSWRAVDLHGDVAWAFARERDGLSVRGASARYALSVDGAARAVGVEGDAPWPQGALEPPGRLDRVEGVFQSTTPQRCAEVAHDTAQSSARRFVCHIGAEVHPPMPLIARECPRGDDYEADDAHRCYGVQMRRLHASDAHVLARRWAGDGATVRWVFGWRSTDARGPFAARTAVGVTTWPVAADEEPPSIDDLQVLTVTRAGVVLGHEGELFWAGRDGGVSAVRDPFLRAGDDDDGRLDMTLSLDLRDGGALLLLVRQIERGLWSETWQTRNEWDHFGFEESVGVALELGPNGAVRARRPMIFAPSPVGLATDGVRHGVVVRRGSDLTLLPTGGGAPVALPPVASLAAPPCSRSPTAGVVAWTLLRDITYESHLTLDPEAAGDGQVDSPSFGSPNVERLEITAAGVCLRGLGVGRDISSHAWLDASADGRLAGVLDHASRVTCRPAPPRNDD